MLSTSTALVSSHVLIIGIFWYVLLSAFEIWTTFPICISERLVASVPHKDTGMMPV